MALEAAEEAAFAALERSAVPAQPFGSPVLLADSLAPTTLVVTALVSSAAVETNSLKSDLIAAHMDPASSLLFWEVLGSCVRLFVV